MTSVSSVWAATAAGLDSPLSSNRNYSVIFSRHGEVVDNTAQIDAFEDTWHWTAITESQYQEFLSTSPPACRRHLKTDPLTAGQLPPRGQISPVVDTARG